VAADGSAVLPLGTDLGRWFLAVRLPPPDGRPAGRLRVRARRRARRRAPPAPGMRRTGARPGVHHRDRGRYGGRQCPGALDRRQHDPRGPHLRMHADPLRLRRGTSACTTAPFGATASPTS